MRVKLKYIQDIFLSSRMEQKCHSVSIYCGPQFFLLMSSGKLDVRNLCVLDVSITGTEYLCNCYFESIAADSYWQLPKTNIFARNSESSFIFSTSALARFSDRLRNQGMAYPRLDIRLRTQVIHFAFGQCPELSTLNLVLRIFVII